MTTHPFDRLQSPPQHAAIPELVQVLRDVHNRKASYAPTSVRVESIPRDVPPASLLLLEQLARGAQSLTSLLGQSTSELSRGKGASMRYGALRGQVDLFEEQARQYFAKIDRLLRREGPAHPAAHPAPYQETLYLQCRRGGRTAGQFRCVNRRERKVSVSLATRPFIYNGEISAPTPLLTVQPVGFPLDPGEVTVIRVDVDLHRCVDFAAGTLKTSIDLRMDDAIALKLWIEIALYE